MDKEYGLKDAADYLGVSVNDLISHTVNRKIGKVRTQRGEPFRYTEESLSRFKVKIDAAAAINEATKEEANRKHSGMLGATEAAKYLEITTSAIQAAAYRGRLVADFIDTDNQNARMFKKSTLDAYKLRTEATKEAVSMTAKMPKTSRADGYETARQLLAYAKSKGYENPWEAIKDLLDANGQN